jgi:hypothetical protein
MLKYLIAGACLLSTTLLANAHPAPGQWSVTGEYLYLKPSIDDTYFVIKSPTPEDNVLVWGDEINNNFKFSSGYRVGLAYAFCECDRELSFSYSHLDANHKKRVRGEFLNPSVGIEDFSYYLTNYSGTAASKLHARYQRFDALFSQKIFQCCGTDIRLVLGLEYADLKAGQKMRYRQEDQTCDEEGFCVFSGKVKQHSKTWGVGPEVGIDFDYDLCQLSTCLPGGLSLNFVSTGSLLLGESKSHLAFRYKTSEGNYPFDVRQQKSTRIIPAYHAKLGINYDFCLCNWEGSVGVGYEFNTYLRSLLRTNNAGFYGYGLTSHEYNDFDLQGFFASLSVRY